MIAARIESTKESVLAPLLGIPCRGHYARGKGRVVGVANTGVGPLAGAGAMAGLTGAITGARAAAFCSAFDTAGVTSSGGNSACRAERPIRPIASPMISKARPVNKKP
jgi:hypothetical protein